MRKPNHATVVAYLALFIAIGTGGAYAVDRITGKEIENGSIRSADLKDRKGVSGRDIERDSITGKEIRENSLNASAFAPVAGINDAIDCNPTGSIASDCVSTGITLQRRSNLVVVATGGLYAAAAAPARASCELRVNGQSRSVALLVGETASTTSAEASDGFARTLVTDDPLPPGTHKVALACSELDADVRIATPTIAVIAVSAA